MLSVLEECARQAYGTVARLTIEADGFPAVRAAVVLSLVLVWVHRDREEGVALCDLIVSKNKDSSVRPGDPLQCYHDNPVHVFAKMHVNISCSKSQEQFDEMWRHSQLLSRSGNANLGCVMSDRTLIAQTNLAVDAQVHGRFDVAAETTDAAVILVLTPGHQVIQTGHEETVREASHAVFRDVNLPSELR